MKTVPLADGSGTIPLRASKNPVLAVFRHHCGEVSTVHQPKGKKSHLRYILCAKCGCDQASGESYQEKIRANSFNSIEELEASELVVAAELEVGTLEVGDLTENVTDNLTETNALPIELGTKQNKVVTVNKPVIEATPEKTVIVTEPVTETKSKTNQEQNNQVPTPNIGRIGLAAIFGGLLGGLLALAR